MVDCPIVALEISCADVLRELSNYFDVEIPAELRVRIDAHFQGCPGCGAVYDSVRNVIMLMAQGDVIELPAGFSERLYRRLNPLQ